MLQGRRGLLIVLLCAFALPSHVARAQCNSPADVTGVVQSTTINEASGLAVSRVNPGVLYTHNDSGDSGRVFAIAENGATVAELRLTGFNPLDVEDICAGSMGGVDFLFVADMGNNDYNRQEMRILRFQEPDLSQANGDVIDIDEYLTYTISSGPLLEQDQETMFFDPVSGDVYVVQKNHFDASADIHKFTPLDTDGTVETQTVGNIPYLLLTAGDVSTDGERIVLKTYEDAFEWQRDPASMSVEEALMDVQPCDLDIIVEPQGESLALTLDRSGFFTTSEGLQQPIYFYPLLD